MHPRGIYYHIGEMEIIILSIAVMVMILTESISALAAVGLPPDMMTKLQLRSNEVL